MAGATLPASFLARHKTAANWLGAILIVGTVAAFAAGPLLRNVIRREVLEAAHEICRGPVELGSLSVRVFPRLYIDGADLVLHWPADGRESSATTIVRRFSIDAGLPGLLRSPRHIDKITLDNIHITVPPRVRPPEQGVSGDKSTYNVETVVANNAVLELLPREERRPSRKFKFFRLVLHSPKRTRPVPYEAVVRIPAPRGDVTSTGQFGPVDYENAGATPVSGRYRFKADLGTLDGVAGNLSSTGRFHGVLARVAVDGETDCPDFTVRLGNHPVHLRTTFHAEVDGRNGDTVLDAVHGSFLKSSVDVSGSIRGSPGQPGKRITLDVRIANARLEDYLKFAVKAPRSPVVAGTDLTVRFDLPQGRGDAWERLRLDGHLGFEDARMTKRSAEAKLNELSNRALGNPEAGGDGNVDATLRSPFTMRRGLVTFPRISFLTDGASAVGSGTYVPRTEAINFKGNVRLSVEVSKTSNGVKGFFLKFLDPFFKKKNAPAVVPVTLTGTLEHPEFKAHLTK